MTHWSDRLPRVTCGAALEWCATQPSAAAAWRNCERGDWMVWIIGWKARIGSRSHKKLVLAVCESVRRVLGRARGSEPTALIESCEAWAAGNVTLAEVCAAINSRERNLAARAGNEAGNTCYRPKYAWRAIYYANRAALSDSDLIPKDADIVRKHFPRPPRLEPRTQLKPGK